MPALAASCGRTIEKGGINALGFVSCSNTTILNAPSTLGNWTTAIAADEARVVKNMIGSLPYPNDVTVRQGACEPEYLQGRVFKLEAKDFDFTTLTVPSFTPEKLNFYNSIMADPSKYYLYYGECQGYMYLVENFTISVSAVTPSDNTQDKYFQLTISFQQTAVPTAIQFDLNAV